MRIFIYASTPQALRFAGDIKVTEFSAAIIFTEPSPSYELGISYEVGVGCVEEVFCSIMLTSLNEFSSDEGKVETDAIVGKKKIFRLFLEPPGEIFNDAGFDSGDGE
jgi:hypothetical protein